MRRAVVDLDPQDGVLRNQVREFLCRARRNAHLSQRELAARMGYHQIAVVRRERHTQWMTSTVQSWAWELGYRFRAVPWGFGVLPEPYEPRLPRTGAAQRTLTRLRASSVVLYDMSSYYAWQRALLVGELAGTRMALHLRQADVAKIAGCTASTLCQFEQNPDDFRVAYAQRYARAMAIAANAQNAYLNLFFDPRPVHVGE